MKKILAGVAFLAAGLQFSGVPSAWAQTPEQVFQATGWPQNPRVSVNWNRYYDYAGLTEICAKLAKAFPDLVKLETIGESFEGRRIWVLTVTDFTSGEPETKPALYLDGSIRSNQIQGAEFALYTAWYLAEHFQNNGFIKELLRHKTFYILPTINPDGRDFLMHAASKGQLVRTGMIPIDDDADGLIDEDQPEDLNQDGFITLMRRKSAKGNYVPDPKNPLRMVPAPAGQTGEYELLGYEGLDSDGDGLVNEDAPGYYDPNRDWGWNWQPDYIQPGAYKYPFSLPETRAVKEFIMLHPNIAGAQSYHYNGGIEVVGPRVEGSPATNQHPDQAVYGRLLQQAEQVIPDFTYREVSTGLMAGYSGKLNWFQAARGVFTFSNELLAPYLQFDRKLALEGAPEVTQEELDKMLLFQDAYVEWTSFEHPTYGPIEIGGFNRNHLLLHPSFLLAEDAHRNMALTLYQAYQLPHLEIQGVTTKRLPNGLTEVVATVTNTRLLPTHSSQDLQLRIERPDFISLKDSTVVSGMVLENGPPGKATEQKLNPARLEVPNIPGRGTVKVRWTVLAHKPNLTVEVNSKKGGIVTRRF
ncbi:M14 family metallopeptidase [Rufibacter psychrotolerans]|uniref:M14 family metallopeptidase n=1 Tax=Rufibacter psychrotolerans TaxID=2812556 RepID=UPI001967BDCA|nr:M14 family metallopeptidase [Rufibacter sp. SYSU D00308]